MAAIRMTRKDAKALLASNAVGAASDTSMAAWVNGCLILELPNPPSVPIHGVAANGASSRTKKKNLLRCVK